MGNENSSSKIDIRKYKKAESKEIGQRIRKMRRYFNLTIDALSEKLDISPSYLGLIERGDRMPGLQKIMHICSIFRVSIDFIIYGNEKETEVCMENEFLWSKFAPHEQYLLSKLAKVMILNEFTENEYQFIVTIIREYLKLKQTFDPHQISEI